jgi:hypothetical protein
VRREREEKGLFGIYILRSSPIQKDIYLRMVSCPGAVKTKGKIDIGN